MASFFFCNRMANLLCTKYVGRVSSRTLLATSRAVRAVPEFDPSLNVLSDLRAVESIDFRSGDLLGHAIMLSEEKRPLPRPVRFAVVVGGVSEDVAAVVRMYFGYAGIAGNAEFSMFEDTREALRWLGVGPDAAELLDGAEWIEVAEERDETGPAMA